MAAINCPDCGNTVSDLAEKCPHCARPNPALSAPQLATQKATTQVGEFMGCLVIGWLLNAFLALVLKGFMAGVMALMMGPLVWMFR